MQFSIGDIIQTYFMSQTYYGFVIQISGDYYYVDLFNTPPNIGSLPLHYSTVTKISS